MQQILPRPDLCRQIAIRLDESPITVLLGARQVGKTTLAQMVAETYTNVTVFDLERPAGRRALARTPELTLAGATGLVIIDEIQRMPSLFELLRPICDDSKRKAIFLLLGSASPDLVKGVSESLAGRALFVSVHGFSMEETGVDNQDRLWLQGGFPRSYLAPPEVARRWLESFSQTFLERDIPQLGLRVPGETLRRFWTMLAHYHGQIWNAAELARSMTVTPKTALHYRDLLTGTFMVRALPPWFENVKKRQVKSPKVYIRDSGLLHYLLGIDSMHALRSHPRYGASWEGFAIEQVLTVLGSRDAYFWATHRGAELDLLLLRRGKRWGFEFKCTDAPSTTRSMHVAFADLGIEHLWVVYPGHTSYPLGKHITALPLRDLKKASARILEPE